MYLYKNGEIIAKDKAVISPFEHGFLYGLGLFETFRVYNGHPFLLDDHLERLNKSLGVMNIRAIYSRAEIVAALNRLLEKNKYRDAYIRMNVSAGAGEIGLQTDPYSHPNLIIFSKPLPAKSDRQEKMAVFLKLNRNTPEGPERLKSHHYLNNILAKKEIGADPSKEGIFLTAEGFLAEGIVSNLFWIKGNDFFTPAIDTGILNGITRQFVIKLALKNGMNVQEGFFTPNDVLEAEEAFVTNSIQEIVPISSFGGQPMPGLTGIKTMELQHQYDTYRHFLWSIREI